VQDVHVEPSQLKLTKFDAALQTLTHAFDAKAAGSLFRDGITIPDERIFIVSWVDYCKSISMVWVMPRWTGPLAYTSMTARLSFFSADKQRAAPTFNIRIT
jgi:cell cycle serine/threonine-protein kinase CDC5/MSD2